MFMMPMIQTNAEMTAPQQRGQKTAGSESGETSDFSGIMENTQVRTDRRQNAGRGEETRLQGKPPQKPEEEELAETPVVLHSVVQAVVISEQAEAAAAADEAVISILEGNLTHEDMQPLETQQASDEVPAPVSAEGGALPLEEQPAMDAENSFAAILEKAEGDTTSPAVDAESVAADGEGQAVEAGSTVPDGERTAASNAENTAGKPEETAGKEAPAAVNTGKPVVRAEQASETVNTAADRSAEAEAAETANAVKGAEAAEKPEAAPVVERDTTVMARMPHAREEAKPSAMPEESGAMPSAEAGNPYPLENENDAGQDASEHDGGEEAAQDKNAAVSNAFPFRQSMDLAPERAVARPAAAPAVPTAPVTADNLFDAMVERIEMSRAAETDQLQIQLKPEYLGKVAITLSMSDSGVRARIQVEDPSVRGMIGNQISQLVESLSEKGLKIEQVDVVGASVADRNFEQSQSGERQSQNRNRARAARLASELNPVFSPVWGETLPPDMIDRSVSSVEYRA